MELYIYFTKIYINIHIYTYKNIYLHIQHPLDKLALTVYKLVGEGEERRKRKKGEGESTFKRSEVE